MVLILLLSTACLIHFASCDLSPFHSFVFHFNTGAIFNNVNLPLMALTPSIFQASKSARLHTAITYGGK